MSERVGIYNRCSTEEESQRNALTAQAAESREIAEKMGWEIAEQYIESETGTVAYRRSEYQRLLGDMGKDRFDIVMIKSIDRLMRSARDWYFFLSRLTENRLRLYIYIEGKFYTPEDNLISGIKAILAEDFSRELSKKIKNAHRRRQEKKSGFNITCDMFGWNKVAKDVYEVNEEEAAYYRKAFLLAKEGKGFYTISNVLYELGARGRNGQRISETQWRKMLYAPRAHGTMILNTRTYNFDTKRYEKVTEKDWIFMEHALPPIVSKEYQEEVIEIMQRRARGRSQGDGRKFREGNMQEGIIQESGIRKMDGKDMAAFGENTRRGKYDFTRKLVCGECGRYYYRTSYRVKGGKRVVWKCAGFLESGRKKEGEGGAGCNNRHLPEDELYRYMEGELEKQYEISEEKKERLERILMDAVGKTLKAGDGRGGRELLEKEQRKLLHKKDVLMEKLLKGVISDKDYERHDRNLTEKLSRLTDKLEGIKKEDEPYNNYEMRLKKIKEAVCGENLIGKAVLKVSLKKISAIEVHKDGGLSITRPVG